MMAVRLWAVRNQQPTSISKAICQVVIGNLRQGERGPANEQAVTDTQRLPAVPRLMGRRLSI